MSEEKKAIIRRFYEELDKKNFEIYAELCTVDYISHFPGNTRPQDRAARQQTSSTFYAALPDLQHTIDDMIADGDKVAARLTARGTHQGVFLGLPGTGKPIMFTGMRFYRIVGGKIAEEWANLDQLGLMQQLGASLAPGADAR
jgi:steroid delta-isomerase-like uncharacterized protein